MRTICIVNNYNYERFLGACLESIAAQTRAFDLVLVVDDGSTDGSRRLITEYATRHAQFKPVFKANGGQLSCFNAVADEIRDEDVVALIDSDDIYPADYLEAIVERHARRVAEFVFCEPAEFTEPPADLLTQARIGGGEDFLLPCSSALVRSKQCWIGSPTSGVSLSGKLYRQIFPYPHESDWITRADDVAVHGASLLGAKKLYVPSVRFGYRVHGNNNFFGRKHSAADEVMRRHRLEKLFGWFCAAQHINPQADNPAALGEHALVPKELWARLNLPDPIKLLPPRKRHWARVKRFFRRLVGQA